jgi:hypothetical protein
MDLDRLDADTDGVAYESAVEIRAIPILRDAGISDTPSRAGCTDNGNEHKKATHLPAGQRALNRASM